MTIELCKIYVPESWPGQYKAWLMAVGQAETTPTDCIVAVAITQSLARGHSEITNNDIAMIMQISIKAIVTAVKRLKELGLLVTTNKRGGARSNSYAITFAIREPRTEPVLI